MNRIYYTNDGKLFQYKHQISATNMKMEIDVKNDIQGNTNANIDIIGNVNVKPIAMVNYGESYEELSAICSTND